MKRGKLTQGKNPTPNQAVRSSHREREIWQAARTFCEQSAMGPVIQNSYVLSRVWSWLTKIEMAPRLRIPVPRFLTYRDP